MDEQEPCHHTATGVEVVMDHRERGLIGALQALHGDQPPPYTVRVAPLDAGDIHISCAGSRMVLERKTAQDLAASIRDGRYREQKTRMRMLAPPHHITYVIEGTRVLDKHAPRGGSVAAMIGAYVSTMYRDGMHTVFVKDVAETAQWIHEIACRWSKDPLRFGTAEATVAEATPAGPEGARVGGDAYIDHLKVKTKKNENIDPPTCYTLMLCQVPGVNVKVAKAITEVYPTLASLMRALEGCSHHAARVGLFQQLPMVGPKKAAQLVAYLRSEGDGDGQGSS